MRKNEEDEMRPSWEGEAEFDREPAGLREPVLGEEIDDEGEEGFVEEGEDKGEEDGEGLGEAAVTAVEIGTE